MALSGPLNLSSNRSSTRDGWARGDGVTGPGGGGGGDGGSASKHLLEIVVVGAKGRVWAAESKQECRRWVRSSHEARFS